MNVWGNAASTTAFISAFRHIAGLARTHCPKVALVFSPNYSSAYQVDMDSFYPGDAYVDWVGVSLYYNRYSNNGDDARDAFYGVGTYGDAMLNVQQAVNLSNLHRKPVIITEGGSAHYMRKTDVSSFASERVEKALSFLPMVYPQIKCIIYSDTNFGASATAYSIYNNATMTAAYDRAVGSNPTLLHKVGGRAAYYTRLSDYPSTWQGTVELAAYTYASGRLTATWYVDGHALSSTSAYPYRVSLNTETLNNGTHTIKVVFSNGASREYSFYHSYVVAGFQDLEVGAYYTNPVVWAVKNGVTNGTSATTFSPNATCTRAQVVTFLWRAEGSPEPQSAANPFTDVKRDDYFYKAVLWAVENGITNGTSATTFSPGDGCTRAQVVTFLHRTEGSTAAGSANPFTDVPAGQYYTDAVLWAVAKNITNGTSATTFSPNATCTRAQIVTFLYRDLA